MPSLVHEMPFPLGFSSYQVVAILDSELGQVVGSELVFAVEEATEAFVGDLYRLGNLPVEGSSVGGCQSNPPILHPQRPSVCLLGVPPQGRVTARALVSFEANLGAGLLLMGEEPKVLLHPLSPTPGRLPNVEDH